MKTRCEAGDIALVLFDEPQCLQNVGRLVRVHPKLMLNIQLKLQCWLIQPLDKSPWIYALADGSTHQTTDALGEQIEHPDNWMMPIRDNALSEEEMAIYERIQDQIDQDLLHTGVVKRIV